MNDSKAQEKQKQIKIIFLKKLTASFQNGTALMFRINPLLSYPKT
jgi:hypothetical protein